MISLNDLNDCKLHIFNYDTLLYVFLENKYNIINCKVTPLRPPDFESSDLFSGKLKYIFNHFLSLNALQNGF